MESQLRQLSVKDSALPVKRLGTNVYKFTTNENSRVWRYTLNVERLVTTEKGMKCIPIKSVGADSIRLIRSNVFRRALQVVSNSVQHREKTIIYDGFDVLYASAVITSSILSQKIQVDELSLSEEDRRIVMRESSVVTVTIKPDQACDLANIHRRIQECDREDSDIVNFFAVLVKSAAPEQQFIAIKGGRLVDITTLRDIGSGMERAKGVKIGTKLIGKEQLTVAIDIDSKEGTFFKPQRLIQSIAEYFNRSEEQVRSFFSDQYAVRQIENFIRDMTVRVESSDTVVCISGVKWEKEEDGRRAEASKDRDGMLLVVEDKLIAEGKVKPIFHRLDVLHILKHTRVPLPKQDKVTRPAALNPQARFDLITKARRDIKIDHQNNNLKGFDTNISSTPVLPLYRILPPPNIFSLNKSTNRMVDVRINDVKRNYNTNDCMFVDAAHIDCFRVIFDTRERYLDSDATARQFFNALGTIGTAKGIQFDQAQYFGIKPDQRLEELEKRLRQVDRERSEHVKKTGSTPVVLVVCVGFKLDHDAIKYLEFTTRVLTQHIMGDTVKRILSAKSLTADRTIHNIFKKINEKCGGANVEVKGPAECASLFPAISAQDNGHPASLIIGMDVCHGAPLSKYLQMRGYVPDPSIIGISSNAQTRNPKMFTGEFIATQGRKEAVPGSVMRDHGRFLVQAFEKNHGRLPDNIVLVRDGVSRSQYEMARGEFAALLSGVRVAVKSPDFRPRELLIIVTKEHNMRLFDRTNSGQVINARPGTIVDTDIVSPFHPEFLMIAQDAFWGTAKVLLATILKDGDKDLNKYSREELKEIEYFLHTLCYLHGISDTPCGLPEPVSVGHDLAERGSNIAKERRFRTGERPSVDELNRWLSIKGTMLEGVKFTA